LGLVLVCCKPVQTRSVCAGSDQECVCAGTLQTGSDQESVCVCWFRPVVCVCVCKIVFVLYVSAVGCGVCVCVCVCVCMRTEMFIVITKVFSTFTVITKHSIQIPFGVTGTLLMWMVHRFVSSFLCVCVCVYVCVCVCVDDGAQIGVFVSVCAYVCVCVCVTCVDGAQIGVFVCVCDNPPRVQKEMRERLS